LGVTLHDGLLLSLQAELFNLLVES
jgi:hypothetical protein